MGLSDIKICNKMRRIYHSRTRYMFISWDCSYSMNSRCHEQPQKQSLLKSQASDGVWLHYYWHIDHIKEGFCQPDYHKFLGQFLQVIVIKLVSSARRSVHPSTKRFSDLNKIWCVGRGWWVLNDGMPYYLIQGQGHGGLKVAKMVDF